MGSGQEGVSRPGSIFTARGPASRQLQSTRCGRPALRSRPVALPPCLSWGLQLCLFRVWRQVPPCPTLSHLPRLSRLPSPLVCIRSCGRRDECLTHPLPGSPGRVLVLWTLGCIPIHLSLVGGCAAVRLHPPAWSCMVLSRASWTRPQGVLPLLSLS